MHGGDVDIPFAGRNGAEFDIIRHRSDIAGCVFNRRAHSSEMDIFDIVFRRQVHNLALQGRVVELSDATRFGADIQRSQVMGISHITRQVDAAAVGVGAGDVDAAHFRAKEADGDTLGGVYGIAVGLKGFCAFRPTGIVVPEPAKESRTIESGSVASFIIR